MRDEMKRHLIPPNPFSMANYCRHSAKENLVLLQLNYSVLKNHPVKYSRAIRNCPFFVQKKAISFLDGI